MRRVAHPGHRLHRGRGGERRGQDQGRRAGVGGHQRRPRLGAGPGCELGAEPGEGAGQGARGGGARGDAGAGPGGVGRQDPGRGRHVQG